MGRLVRRSALVLALLAGSAGIAQAADPAPPAASAVSAPQVAGWNEFVNYLRDLPSRMLARLPEPLQRDPQVQQEIGRLALEALASSTIDTIGGDGDHPVFLPSIGQLLNVGQPNADTIYRGARITPGGTYRIRGRRGSLRLIRLGQSGPPAPGASNKVGAMKSYLDINALHVDAEGRYDFILSPTRPAGYTGDWWQLDPTANRLMLRTVGSDWQTERDPTISIERLDVPVARSRPSAADLEQRLRRLPQAISFIGELFIDHVEGLRREGYINRLKVFDVSQLGGLAGQFYYEGAYELRDDEALIVEARVPKGCSYRSIILTNDIYETTDWYNNQSSLNDAQAKADDDGVLRVVVSARDPGVPNWLDTAGYSRGAIQGRWMECSSQPIPNIRKVKFADILNNLPRSTPSVSVEERQRIIRDRRSAFQQRPLW